MVAVAVVVVVEADMLAGGGWARVAMVEESVMPLYCAGAVVCPCGRTADLSRRAVVDTRLFTTL